MVPSGSLNHRGLGLVNLPVHPNLKPEGISQQNHRGSGFRVSGLKRGLVAQSCRGRGGGEALSDSQEQA